ncbi:MAG: hypothetical protein KAJ32_07390 [Gammaproteobacteria bacterium]|nr:hypothetical protein [Gammaproteobacteria bacterium]
MKFILHIISLLFVLLMNDIAVALDTGPLSGLSALSESDIRNSAIAFVNTTSSPGLEGATLDVDDDIRDSDQQRSSLGFNAEITMKDHIFNGYWGLGLVNGTLKDRLQFTSDTGQPVTIDLRRDITSLRGSAGLSFPINQHFKLLPVLTLAISDVRTRSTFDGLLDSNNDPVTLSFDNSVQMVSTTGSINALYWHWYDNYKLELSAHYNQIYTDAVSEDNPILDTHVWHQTSQLKSRISGPTSLTMGSRP